MATVDSLPIWLHDLLLDPARAAFTHGLNIISGIGGLLVAALAILAVRLLPRTRPGHATTEPSGAAATEATTGSTGTTKAEATNAAAGTTKIATSEGPGPVATDSPHKGVVRRIMSGVGGLADEFCAQDWSVQAMSNGPRRGDGDRGTEREASTLALIIAGKLYVDPADRDRFVAGHRDVVAQSRRQPGCLDLSISPDPAEPDRVNMFEYWDSQEALDAWRAIAPTPSVSVEIKDGQVLKHEIANSGPPFD
ncbi:antibiotic biosynthesis monooxygenase [Streptomyces sp. NPDC002851]